MNSKILMAIVSIWLFTGHLTCAQAEEATSSTSFGEMLTQASLISALQSAGFQALPAPPPPSPIPGANPFIGAIQTGSNGAKILIVLTRCDNSKTDEICSLILVSTFTDDKGILNDSLIGSMNMKTVVAKVTLVHRPNGTEAMNIVYSYPCKGFSDTKFLLPVLVSFSGDIPRVLTTYTAAAQSAAQH